MASREPVAWVLNLDAEDELLHGHTHTPAASLEPRVKKLLPALRGLVLPHDTLVYPRPGLSEPVEVQSPLGRRRWGEHGPAQRLTGRAWCPTRWALKQLEAAGVEVPRAPSMAILRRVNHRLFSHELGQTLPLAGYARTPAELEALLSANVSDVSVEGQWLLKRPLGYAGRGRKKWRPNAVTSEERAWLEASWPEGVQVEPLVQRTLDVGLHGFIEEGGACLLGTPTMQDLDSSGAWVSSRLVREGELAEQELQALHREAERTARALQREGYFGPFGIDAFRWNDARGVEHFQPRCEINARYSMGWAVGMNATE